MIDAGIGGTWDYGAGRLAVSTLALMLGAKLAALIIVL
jgi:hypothetical protein